MISPNSVSLGDFSCHLNVFPLDVLSDVEVDIDVSKPANDGVGTTGPGENNSV
jgi:hypothetical protein